jgi:hypothetical protein
MKVVRGRWEGIEANFASDSKAHPLSNLMQPDHPVMTNLHRVVGPAVHWQHHMLLGSNQGTERIRLAAPRRQELVPLRRRAVVQQYKLNRRHSGAEQYSALCLVYLHSTHPG